MRIQDPRPYEGPRPYEDPGPQEDSGPYGDPGAYEDSEFFEDAGKAQELDFHIMCLIWWNLQLELKRIRIKFKRQIYL